MSQMQAGCSIRHARNESIEPASNGAEACTLSRTPRSPVNDLGLTLPVVHTEQHIGEIRYGIHEMHGHGIGDQIGGSFEGTVSSGAFCCAWERSLASLAVSPIRAMAPHRVHIRAVVSTKLSLRVQNLG